MVTHPAYWRRGHARKLVDWAVALAKRDPSCIGVGVAAAPTGRELYAAAGFKTVSTVEMPGYEHHPEPVLAWMCVKDNLILDADEEGHA